MINQYGYLYGTIKHNNTVYNLPADNILLKGFNNRANLSSSESIELGAVGGKNMSCLINNKGLPSNLKYRDSEINLKYNERNNVRELGSYVIEEAMKNRDIVRIDSYDKALKLNQTYSRNKLSYPTTLQNVITDVGSSLGIKVNSNFLNNKLTVNLTDKTLYSYRDIVSFVAAMSGGFAKIGVDDVLTIQSYNSRYNSPIKVDKEVKGVKIGEMLEITGVVYYDSEGNRYVSGNDKNPLIIPNNPFIESLNSFESFVKYIGDIYIGMTYYPLDIELFYMQDIEPGDVVEYEGMKTFVVSIYKAPGGSMRLTTSSAASVDVLKNESNQLKKSRTIKIE